MDAGWAAVAAAAVTGATAVITLLLTQRYERRRADAERRDRRLAQLLEPRLRAHEQLVEYLVRLDDLYTRFAISAGGGAGQVKPVDTGQWGPLEDLDEASQLYAANRLWLGPRVASAFQEVLQWLSLSAAAALGTAGSPEEFRQQVETMSRRVAESARACQETIHAALGIPALESAGERSGGKPKEEA